MFHWKWNKLHLNICYFLLKYNNNRTISIKLPITYFYKIKLYVFFVKDILHFKLLN